MIVLIKNIFWGEVSIEKTHSFKLKMTIFNVWFSNGENWAILLYHDLKIICGATSFTSTVFSLSNGIKTWSSVWKTCFKPIFASLVCKICSARRLYCSSLTIFFLNSRILYREIFSYMYIFLTKKNPEYFDSTYQTNSLSVCRSSIKIRQWFIIWYISWF